MSKSQTWQFSQYLVLGLCRIAVTCWSRIHTSFMSLMAIQLLPPSTSRSNNRGARGRKSCGRRHPNSHTTFTIAAVTLGSSLGSIRRSLIFGHAALRASGYTSAKRYRVTNVFFLMLDWLCPKRGRRSARVESAKDGVMTCGSVAMGRDMTIGVDDPRSYNQTK